MSIDSIPSGFSASLPGEGGPGSRSPISREEKESTATKMHYIRTYLESMKRLRPV